MADCSGIGYSPCRSARSIRSTRSAKIAYQDVLHGFYTELIGEEEIFRVPEEGPAFACTPVSA